MDARLIALKLFLDALGVPADIDTIDDRKRVQKAVYLGQLSDVDLGYRFSWYLKGVYSPSLTRDYYSLAEAVASKDRDWEDKELQESVRQLIQKILPLFKVPADVGLAQEDWLELVSSLIYLKKVGRLSADQAAEHIKANKPHLASFVDKARERLEDPTLPEKARL